MKPLFFELMRWGDFDIPYTDSVWYKSELADNEMEFHNKGILLKKMLLEFMQLSGKKVSITTSQTKHSIVCKDNESETFEEFKHYLIARGYKQLETTKLHFTDGQ